MATPAITDFILYTSTPLTDTDYEFNWTKLVDYVTDGTFDFTIKSLTVAAGDVSIKPASDSTTTFEVVDTSDVSILAVDTTNSRVVCPTNLYIGGADICPLGAMTLFAGATAPTGWLICDGSAISRSTYADLFAIVSTTYGAGDTTTTFNIPDLRDKFAIGKSGSKALGSTGGSTTIAEVNLPSHVHSLSTTVSLHAHTSKAVTAAGVGTTAGTCFLVTGSTVAKRVDRTITDLEQTSDDNASLTGDTAAVGSGTAYNQPYQALNYIIRAL